MRIALFLLSVVFTVLVVFHFACSIDEAREMAERAPALSPVTRTAEQIQQRIDPIAQQGQEVSRIVRDVADEGAELSIPGAGLIALVASIVGTLLGAYNERRRRTLPLRSALEQVVESVEAAFPEKSDVQKAAMSAVQDPLTRRFVREMKGR